jgi:pantoate--beta-alanine ligase
VKVLRTPQEIHALRDSFRGRTTTTGLVPTMGFLHEGHVSLLEAARERCDQVVMSLFVNPTQFAPDEDLSEYPRDEERDFETAERAGVDFIYAPSPEDVYPTGFSTRVEVGGLTEVLCGDPKRRGAGHFAGVTTVVAKLLNAVDPDFAFFGQKDAQQALVIKRMAADLEFRTEIVVLPTVREADGLAMSSRNAYLSPQDRNQATAIFSALQTTQKRFSEDGLKAAVAAGKGQLEAAGIEPEYFEARNPSTLEMASDEAEAVLVAVAAEVGGTRLIDNILIETERQASRS